MEQTMWNELRALRRRLHGCAERSGAEFETARLVSSFLGTHTSLSVYDQGNWLYAVHEEPGAPVIAFRADLDAVSDGAQGAAHRCGHDGHTAALCGLALLLEGRAIGKTVYLVFQPAEETGAGAKQCVPVLAGKGIAACFSSHNLPGFPRGQIVTRPDVFACASRGLTISFTGTPAHAAYPEFGRNPAHALGQMLCALAEDADPARYRGMVLCTVVGTKAGERAFGVAASTADLWLTIRGHYGDDLEALQARLTARARALAGADGLEVQFSVCDDFTETACAPALVESVRAACVDAGLDVQEAAEPFRWSEDFGQFAALAPIVFFGVGASETCPALHTAAYEYPDDLLEPTSEAYFAIAQAVKIGG